MKIKLDENLPAELPTILRKMGYDADSVMEEGLAGSSDDVVWDAAQREQRLLITQDLDFCDLRKFIASKHAGLMLVRLRHTSRHELISRIKSAFLTERVKDWAGAFVVVAETKTRIRKTTED